MSLRWAAVVLLFCCKARDCSGLRGGEETRKPNIVFLYTDDQDVSLGGMSPMAKTGKLMFQQGAVFENFFVTTPICCASRSSLLTGRYAHNLNDQQLGWCGEFTKAHQNKTFAKILQDSGYATGMFGKFVNDLNNYCGKNAHVPKGWDKWFHTCRLNTYFNISFCDDGKMVQYGDSPSDYMTSLIGNRSVEFIKEWEKGCFR